MRPAPASPAAVDLSVLIVSHNSTDVLPRCLDALIAQGELRLEVIVVDNGSAERPQHHPRLNELICNPDNPGFAVACNQAAARARAPWLLFLNPDCFPGPGDLARLLALGEQANVDADLGVLGVQLLNPMAVCRRRPAATTRRRSACWGVFCAGAPALKTRSDRIGSWRMSRRSRAP
jgi:N-acetylglucosaminyl-diphospho-decaprenol L-rhamnosyltransferase